MHKLQAFCDRVGTLQPRALNSFGHGIPAAGGSSVLGQGSSTDSELIRALFRLMHELRKAKESASVEKIAESMQGVLLNCAATGLLSSKETEELIAQLQEAVQEVQTNG